MKGTVSKLLRRWRSARGFTMTETLLGVAVTGLLVMGVCSAVISSAASTKETDVVEFFDGASQNAIAAFRSNAEKAVLMSADAPEPFGSMKQEVQGENTVVFTGYYDANLKALPTDTADTDTAAAYKVVYTATFKSELRENFDFTESEVKLDIANYERNASKDGWVLREHNQNMEGATGSGDATTVRVLSLNDDSSISDLDPKDPEIEEVIPVEPADYQTVTLTADLTGKRYYWDITQSKVDFTASGNALQLTSTAESITKAKTNENDQTAYTVAVGSGDIASLKEKIGTKPTNIIVELSYDYVNIQKILKNNSGYTIKTTVGTTGQGDALSNFPGTGASFDLADDALENLKTILGITGNKNVTLTILPKPQEADVGGTGLSGSYAMSIIVPSSVPMTGPYTISFKKSKVEGGKQYYSIHIYNAKGQDLMTRMPEMKWGSVYVTDYIYFGYGTNEVSNINLYIYMDQEQSDVLYGSQGPTKTYSDALPKEWYHVHGDLATVEAKVYEGMTHSDSDITLDTVTVANIKNTRYTVPKGTTNGLKKYEKYKSTGLGTAAFYSLSGKDGEYGWYTGEGHYWGSSVVKNKDLTWYAGQTEPQYQSGGSSTVKTFDVSALKAGGLIPHLFEISAKK